MTDPVDPVDPVNTVDAVMPDPWGTPVAQVAVDLPLAHLDRPFDYAVPESMRSTAQPGVRVRVRFSGQLVDGFVLARVAGTSHRGRLAPLARVVSPEPVLAPEVATLARAVADRYGGTLADVLRLAVPPRHAAVEREPDLGAPVTPALQPGPDRQEPTGRPRGLDAYPSGRSFLRALESGEPARAVWGALPGPGVWDALAQAVAATVGHGRGVLVVVPDARDLAHATESVSARLDPGLVRVLTADLGPKERYRRWLAVRRGSARVVLGTRAAMFAPVADLGLAVVWDDGDDLHAEPRAPYPHVREVLALRSHLTGCALLAAGRAVTTETAAWVERGFARPITPARAAVRAAAPRVRALDDTVTSDADPLARAARLPSVAWHTARDALADGPVLVQVPRRGYVPGLACAGCHHRAQCGRCQGPLGIRGRSEVPQCRWCGAAAVQWQCPHCGRRRLWAWAIGARRTAEELGRAFPSVPVVTSGRDATVAQVPDRPALVVATPGAEPDADGGYTAALLLDGAAMLARADLRVTEETLRRWLNAAALVRPASTGGRVVVMAPAELPAVQALVRWDPAGFAARELAERRAASLPPAVRVATVQGSPSSVDDVLRRAALPAGVEVLGPLPVSEDQVRAVVRGPLDTAAAFVAALRAAQGERSARKEPEHVRLQVDPVAFG